MTQQDYPNEEHDRTRWRAVEVVVGQHHGSLCNDVVRGGRQGFERDRVVVGREEMKRSLSLWHTRAASAVLGGFCSGGWKRQQWLLKDGPMMVTGGVEEEKERKFYNVLYMISYIDTPSYFQSV